MWNTGGGRKREKRSCVIWKKELTAGTLGSVAAIVTSKMYRIIVVLICDLRSSYFSIELMESGNYKLP